MAIHGSIHHAVLLSGVRFGWPGDTTPVVEIHELSLRPGERVFVSGPSGSGKSTLLNVLAGVLEPQQGSVRVLGRDIFALSGPERDRFRADHVGYIFQLFNLVPYLSVVENVLLPCRFSRERRARALQHSATLELECARLMRALDMADERLLRAPARRLSVGQQQRVAVARALIGAPELVIADEPTSSLDTERRDGFLDLMFAHCSREEATVVFASHDRSLGALFDRVIDLAELRGPERRRAAAGLSA